MLARTGRAIIIKDNNLVLIKRTKYNEDGSIKNIYYTFPGGHLEGDETFEQATIRELYEELSINVEIEKEFFYLHNKDLSRDEKFYLVNIIAGEIKPGNGPEFEKVDYIKYGNYEIVYIPINQINEYNILPIEMKQKLLSYFKKVN